MIPLPTSRRFAETTAACERECSLAYETMNGSVFRRELRKPAAMDCGPDAQSIWRRRAGTRTVHHYEELSAFASPPPLPGEPSLLCMDNIRMNGQRHSWKIPPPLCLREDRRPGRTSPPRLRCHVHEASAEDREPLPLNGSTIFISNGPWGHFSRLCQDAPKRSPGVSPSSSRRISRFFPGEEIEKMGGGSPTESYFETAVSQGNRWARRQWLSGPDGLPQHGAGLPGACPGLARGAYG
jgi:hypothetical protein